MTVPYAEATTVGQGWWFSSLAEDAQIRFLHGNCSFAKPISPLGDPVREDGAITSFSSPWAGSYLPLKASFKQSCLQSRKNMVTAVRDHEFHQLKSKGGRDKGNQVKIYTQF